MRKRIFITGICMCLVLIVAAQDNEGLRLIARKQTTFNQDWRFMLGDNPEYREFQWDDSDWRQLNVPHDWSIEGEYQPDKYLGNKNGYFPEGIGWYRKHFTIDDNKKDKKFVIQFDGVYMNSEVWVNGFFIGRRPWGYATFKYDITSRLNFGEGKENVIAVRVDNSVPAGSRWYAGSGIYRNVHLIESNFVHFSNSGGIYVTTPVAEKEKAVVHVDYSIHASFFSNEEIKLYKKNKWLRPESRWKNTPAAHDCTIRSIVYDANGKEVARSEDEASIYNYDKHFEISSEMEVSWPNRWSDNDPYTYLLKSEIEYDGEILDDQLTRFGIRKLEYIPNEGMFVNGERELLKGVCLHHDGGSVGVAVPEKVLYYRLKKLQEIGCNAIRTAHNPFRPEFYDMCDTMGIYVFDEVFDEWTSAWGYNFTENNTSKAGFGYALIFNQWAETDLKDIIWRDRNHPSVVIWGIGNEIPEFRSEHEDAKAIARRLIEICHEEDKSRPVALGNSHHWAGILDEIDLLGFNYMKGSYHDYVASDTLYEEAHKAYPDKLIFGSETSRNEIDYFLAYRDLPYVIGQFIWTGIEYFGEVKAPSLGQRGWVASLMDMSCNIRYEGAMYSSCWNEKPVIHISVSELPFDTDRNYKVIEPTGERVYDNSTDRFSWNWDHNDRKFVTVHTNCDEIELKLNGKSLGRKKTDFRKYNTQWEVKYKPGKLLAIGYRGGDKIMEKELSSTGSPSQILAKPFWEKLEYDGVDVNIIEVSVCDENGLFDPEATNNVKVEVSGSARLLGIDTGNLYYKGSYRADNRDAANGYMLVLIRSKKGDQPVSVKLSSEGLGSTEVKL